MEESLPQRAVTLQMALAEKAVLGRIRHSWFAQFPARSSSPSGESVKDKKWGILLGEGSGEMLNASSTPES